MHCIDIAEYYKWDSMYFPKLYQKNILVKNSSRVTDHVDFYDFHEPTPRRVQSKTLRRKFDNLSPKKS